ncbi:Hsp20/alpha crystallin family protein [Natrononativus amylolyticus]|uniref:Hsp20/alpha crystallin family protein n=1 Tax=Natrononativus amylolyticus TaxID=2963434 RepID=UPI0020CC5D68|nr:Hsp20/alpha crystallin family protein [Natrononativus amylolyticus]
MRSFDEMNRMFREMDRTFEQLRRMWWDEFETPALESPSRPALEGEGTPRLVGTRGEAAMSLEREGEGYVFVMDLPGFEREEIDLTFEEGLLSVRARSDRESGDEGRQLLRERRVARQVTIPAEVVEDEISASYRNGVLEVHLPMLEAETAEESRHRIDIE